MTRSPSPKADRAGRLPVRLRTPVAVHAGQGHARVLLQPRERSRPEPQERRGHPRRQDKREGVGRGGGLDIVRHLVDLGFVDIKVGSSGYVPGHRGRYSISLTAGGIYTGGLVIDWVKGSVSCFVLYFALQREEGEKREGVKISKESTKNL